MLSILAPQGGVGYREPLKQCEPVVLTHLQCELESRNLDGTNLGRCWCLQQHARRIGQRELLLPCARKSLLSVVCLVFPFSLLWLTLVTCGGHASGTATQWCSQHRNLRDRYLDQTSRPRPRPHVSLIVIKANYLKNAAQNIWNVATYQDKGVCCCYTSINLFYSKKFVNCLETLPVEGSGRTEVWKLMPYGRIEGDALMKLPYFSLGLSTEVCYLRTWKGG